MENKTTIQDFPTNWRDDSISSTKSPEMSSTWTNTPGWAGAQAGKAPKAAQVARTGKQEW